MDDYNFSYTMLANWRRCRYRFWLRYVEKVPDKPGIGQVKGSAGHAALAEWIYSRDEEKALSVAEKTFSDTLTRNGLPFDDFAQSAWEEIEEALMRYFPYSLENDRFTHIASELEFNIAYKDHNLRGFIDAIVEYNGQEWLMEHKFNKRVYTQHLDLDPQVSIYLLAARLIDFQPVGVFYNIIRMGGGKTAEKEPVVRKLLYRNPEGLRAVGLELMEQMEEVSAWLENPTHIYRNPTKDCTWDCPFYRVCLSVEDSGDGSPVISMLKKEFNSDTTNI